MAEKAPQAPMNRRTTYQAAGTRSTGSGSTITTQGGGSTVTMNPGSQKGATKQLPSQSASGQTSPRPSSPSQGSKGKGGTSGKSSSGGKKSSFDTGKLFRFSGGSSDLTNYQGIILAEFVAAELLVAATPIATRRNQPGLSPYVPRDLVKLVAIGLVYFILQLTATGGRGTGRIGAWFGGLVLLAVGLNEAASLAKVFAVLSGGSGKQSSDIQTVAAQPSAFQQVLAGAPGIGASAGPAAPGGGTGGHSGSAFAAEAAKFIGDPYVWGAAGPTSFDCSGLVQYALDRLGLKNVPRTSEEQWAWVQRISRDQLAPGDLIFEQWPGEASPGHVAIYAGGGQIIQAPAPGEDVQKVPWSPSMVHGQGGQIVGYGRVPGLSYAAPVNVI